MVAAGPTGPPYLRLPLEHGRLFYSLTPQVLPTVYRRFTSPLLSAVVTHQEGLTPNSASMKQCLW